MERQAASARSISAFCTEAGHLGCKSGTAKVDAARPRTWTLPSNTSFALILLPGRAHKPDVGVVRKTGQSCVHMGSPRRIMCFVGNTMGSSFCLSNAGEPERQIQHVRAPRPACSPASKSWPPHPHDLICSGNVSS